MESYLAVLTGILAAITFVYYPTAFLVGVSVWLLQLYFLNEHLFCAATAYPLDWRDSILPSRAEFLRTGPRPFSGTANDVCPICRDQPAETIQLRCQHLFCKTCFMEWVNRGHRRCPLCASILFSSQDRIRALEFSVKLCIAAMAVCAPLATFDLFFGNGNRVWIILSTVTTVFQWCVLLHARESRANYGTSWWKDVYPSAFQAAANDLEEPDIFWWLCRSPVALALYLAVGLDTQLPEYYLYRAFCVA